MLIRMLKGIIVCLILNGFTPLLAQDTTAYPVKWSLQVCFDYATKNNVQLNTLRLSQRTSEQEYLLSKSAVLPNLNASATQSLVHGNNFNSATGSRQSGITPTGSYGINSSWTLYQGGFLKSDIQQKNLQVESANLAVLQQENNITLSITQAYLAILLDKENIIYEKDVVSTDTAEVNQGQRRLNAGSIAKKDLAQLQSQLANDKYTLITIQNTMRQDQLTLKQLLQLPTLVHFDVVEPDTVIAKSPVAPLDEVINTALQNRPEVKNSELGIKIAQIDLDKARSGYMPTLVAGGSLSSNYTGNDQSGYFSQLNNNFYQQIGVTLSIPIFTRRVNKTNVEVAKIGIDQANLNLKDTKTTLSENVERAYISVQNAQSQYDAAVEAFQYNKETYRVANEQLRLGVANMVEFLQQKTLYIQALQAFIQAKYNAALTAKLYDYYRGVPIKI